MKSDFSLDDLFPIPLCHSCFSFASRKQEHHHDLDEYQYGGLQLQIHTLNTIRKSSETVHCIQQLPLRQVKRHQNTPCMNSCPYLELPLNLIWNQKMPMTLTYTQSNLLCFYTTLAPQISIPKLLFKALTQKFSILPDYTPSFLQSDAFCCGADTIVDQSIGHCTVGQSLIA